MKKFYVLFLAVILAFTTVYGQTLISNGDLELWTAGQPDNFSVSIDGTDMTLSQGVAEGRTGDAFKLVANSNGSSAEAYIETIVPILEGHTYDISCWVKSNDDEVDIRYWDTRFLDAGGSSVGSDYDEIG